MKRVLFLILLLLLTSCQRYIPEETGVTFTDALKREITVNDPQNVACLIGSFADVWTLAGGRVAAAPEDAWEDFDLDLENCINIGGAHSPSLELLLSAKADFVIASASTSSNVALKDTLEAMGITVAYFDVDNFNDYLHMLNICTDITGRKDLYKQNGLEIKEKIDSLLENDIPPEKKKVLLLRASSGFVKAKGSEGTVLGEMLSDFGCINIADNNKNLLENLSIEAIIKEDPYHIFIVTMGSDSKKAIDSLFDMIEENPAWSSLLAVKENRLHIMDKKLFNLKPDSRWGEAYEILYKTLCEK